MISNVEFKVVGVSFTNEDGVKRQDVIANLRVNDMVMLQREPANQYDTNAVAVMSLYGQVGYVGKEYAKILGPMIDAGKKFKAQVIECDIYKKTRYCKIRVDEVI